MYLSKLVLNYRNGSAQRDLSNVHKLHQRIMQAFPDEQRDDPRRDWNVLFRQEPDSEVILVQSALEPDWTYLDPRYLRGPVMAKPIQLEIQQFPAGRVFQFRLRANPSKRDHQTRKTVGLFRREDQLAWLERQAKQHGFQLQGLDVIPSPNLFGKKVNQNKPIQIKTVMYQGILEVMDSDLLLQAIRQGIGRGKSYGCGLLSLAKLQS